MADIVLLSFISAQDFAYIDTSNLDGEKALKPKLPILDKDIPINKFTDEIQPCILEKFEINYRDNVESLSEFEGNAMIKMNG